VALSHSPRIVTDGLAIFLDAGNPKNYNLTAVEVLVVAGGGGGGGRHAGGGGGGGVIYNSNFAVTPGSAVTVTVGNGGAASSYGGRGGNGENSVFGSLTAIGGGGGGGYDNGNPTVNGSTGGSGGGGAAATGLPGGNGTGASGTSGQGNAGATPINFSDWAGGGGGGAGENGYAPNGFIGGNGGAGLGFNISGTFTYYGGGGGGAGGGNIDSNGGLGGRGGGGRGTGAYTPTQATAGQSNTGGGGGGSRDQAGPAGGSGIVIVRYPGPQKAIGGTVTSIGGYTIHTFTSTGSTTFTPLVGTNNSSILGLSDFSGGNNFATSVNGPTYSSSNGGSIVFDGVDDYVNCGNPSSLNFGTGNFTISFVVYTTAYGFQGGSYVGKGNGTTIGFDFRDYVFYVYGTLGLIAQGAFAATLNVWEHHTIVYDSSSSPYVKFYKNGAYTGGSTTNNSANISSITTSEPFRIGLSVAGGPTRYFNGRMPLVQAYNRALTVSEVLQNFNALRGRFGI
jgi:hypothetical protein